MYKWFLSRSIEDYWVFLIFGPVLIASFFIALNYILYPICAVLGFMLLLRSFNSKLNRIKLDLKVVIAFLLFLIISSLSFFSGFPDLNWVAFYRDTIILSLPFFGFIFLSEFKVYHMRFLFLCMILCYLIAIDFNVALSFLSNFIEADQLNSNEFIAGFIFGLFFVFFAKHRDWLFVVFSAILVLLTGKRVTTFAVVSSFVLYYFAYKPFLNSKVFSRILPITIYLAFFFLAFNLVELTRLVLDITDLSYSLKVTRVLAARDIFIEVIVPYFEGSSILQMIFGHGAGQTDALLQDQLSPFYYSTNSLGSPHNDFLKILYDYGLIGVSGFFFILTSFYVKEKKNYIIFFYIISVFLLDNSFIVLFNTMIGLVAARVK